MAQNAMLYTAVYDDMGSALADLDAFEQLHNQQLLGDYDAAVVDKEDGHPHIVKRVDRPRIHVIPELLGAGMLKRKELHELADELGANEAALVVVGEPTLEKGVRSSRHARGEDDGARVRHRDRRARRRAEARLQELAPPRCKRDDAQAATAAAGRRCRRTRNRAGNGPCV